MLDLKSISKTFNAGTVNEKTALNNLCLHLNDGDFVTVIGGNGAGKSTFIKILGGVYTKNGGELLMRARLRSAASMSQSFRNISVQSI